MKHFADPRPVRTGTEAVDAFERFCARIPERQSTYEVMAELEATAKRLRAQAAPSTLTPFPDPEGEDRDERRVTTWDFTR